MTDRRTSSYLPKHPVLKVLQPPGVTIEPFVLHSDTLKRLFQSVGYILKTPNAMHQRPNLTPDTGGK